MAIETMSEVGLRESLIVDPASSTSWDQVGQAFIRERELEDAARCFSRASLLDPGAYSALMRLAMTQELSGNLHVAAENYLKCARSLSGDTSMTALYRAVGCFQKLKSFEPIVDIATDLHPGDWNDHRGMHETVGAAYLSCGDPIRAIEWIFSAPVEQDRDPGFRRTLGQVLAAARSSTDLNAAGQLLSALGATLFRSKIRARNLVFWIGGLFPGAQFEQLIRDSGLVELSDGACLPTVVNAVAQFNGNAAARKWARMSMALNPADGAGFLFIVPDESEVPDEKSIRDWMTTWSKAAIVCTGSDAVAVNNAAVTLKTGDREDSRSYLIVATRRFPDNPVIQYNVGAYFNILALAETAEPMLKRALVLQPDYAKALSSFSVSHCIMLHDKEAISAARWAMTSNPRLQSAYTNLAMAYRGAGDLRGAISIAEKSLELDPSDPMSRMGLAFNQLATGAIERGFENYLCRWAQKTFPSEKRPFPQPEWKRQKLPSDKKIVVYMEQGMGDEIMFSWFLHHLDRLYPGQILVDCDTRLLYLFARSFPSIRFYPRESARPNPRLLEPDVRFKVPIGHLPHYFTFEIRQLIRERWALAVKPYVEGYGWLKLREDRVEHWSEYLRGDGRRDRLIVGIAWRSGNLARARRVQYVTPSEVIDSLPAGCVAVNLQYVYTDDEIREIEQRAEERGIEFLTIPGLDLKDDLDEVMNLCGALDALATPLTSTAFMGGSIGKPTFVFRTSASSFGTWQQLGTPHIPWLPSIRLMFRDPRESWDEPIRTVRERLTELQSDRSGRD